MWQVFSRGIFIKTKFDFEKKNNRLPVVVWLVNFPGLYFTLWAVSWYPSVSASFTRDQGITRSHHLDRIALGKWGADMNASSYTEWEYAPKGKPMQFRTGGNDKDLQQQNCYRTDSEIPSGAVNCWWDGSEGLKILSWVLLTRDVITDAGSRE